ncbi:MAG: sulfotransferase, partial [Spirochaetota bacterium]|nr:sulfotransferase [Spirochaetota bacterium]
MTEIIVRIKDLQGKIYHNINLPQNPIFIVGYPRSGTTLLQTMLATQKNVFSLPETHFFSYIYNQVLSINQKGLLEKSCVKQTLDEIEKRMDLSFSSEERTQLILIVENNKITPKELFEQIVYQFIRNDIEKCQQPYHWVEKTPNHAYNMNIMLSYYPEAKFVNIIRNPIYAIHSRKKKFAQNKETPVEDLAKMWLRSVQCGEDLALKYPEKIYTLKYEDLVYNPDKEF